jgi:hypothetical protein
MPVTFGCSSFAKKRCWRVSLGISRYRSVINKVATGLGGFHVASSSSWNQLVTSKWFVFDQNVVRNIEGHSDPPIRNPRGIEQATQLERHEQSVTIHIHRC